MRIRFATLTMALGLVVSLSGTASADHTENCSFVEGNTLQLCERRDVLGNTIDLTTLRTQLDAAGMTMLDGPELEDAVQGDAVTAFMWFPIHNIFPVPQDRTVTATVTYDGLWHVTVTETIGTNFYRVGFMLVMLLAAVLTAVFEPHALKLTSASKGIISGFLVGMIMLLLGFITITEVATMVTGIALTGMLIWALSKESGPLLMALFVGILTTVVAYGHHQTGDSWEALIEWFLYCTFCIATQYIVYIIVKYKRTAKPQIA